MGSGARWQRSPSLGKPLVRADVTSVGHRVGIPGRVAGHPPYAGKMQCPSCGVAVGAGARFCASCGHGLVNRSDERRIATVVFADLVGFTSLSESRDPEQVKNLVDACFQLLVRDVTSFGGQVDKIIGDAIVALFGAPVAHEDDAERAVRAALRMQETVRDYRVQTGAPVELRIGVNTGEVLVGALRAGGDYTAMGDVVNTAQRLETVAEPGSVVVGSTCHTATREAISYQALGSFDVKGRDEAVEAWIAVETLLPPGHRPRRMQTPFLGRDAELGVLANAVDAAVERHRSHLLLLIGDAGVGKSRLAEEAAAAARRRHDARVLEGRCVPYGEANVWWPIAEALRQACDIPADSLLATAEPRAVAAVALALGLEVEAPDVIRVANGLLFFMGYEVPLREIDPQRAREEASRSVLAFIEGATSERPVVMVLSDLHWADDLVLDLVATLVDRLCRRPFVLVATARQAVTDRWTVPTGRHNTVVVNLDPLDQAAAGALLDSLVDHDVTPDLRDMLLSRSGGNPFFLEELVALVSDAERGPTAGQVGALGDLPDTLRGLVAARLDGLTPAERGTLEDASVWGRSGPTEALAKMAKVMRDTSQLDPTLASLDDKEILEVEGEHWRFRSDLIREVAYGTLTKADRARRHHGIAAYIASTVGDCAEASERLVDMVAFHFGAAADLVADLGPVPGVPADVTELALQWLTEAARRAEVAQALPVADRLYSQAIGLVGTDPSAQRAHLLLGRAAVRADRRFTDDARADARAAHALARSLGDEAVLARALLVRGEIERTGGDLAGALATLDDAVARYEALGDVEGAAHALRQVGLVRIFAGENEQAEAAIRAALSRSRQVADRRGEAWALQHLAWISFVEGRADEAENRLTRAADTFAEIGDLGGIGWADGLLAYVCYIKGDLGRADELGQQVLGEARERGDRWGEGMMLQLASGVRCWSGRTGEALEYAREAHALFAEIGDRFGEAQSLTTLGRVLVAVGRVGEGLTILRDGLDAAVADPDSKDRTPLVTGLAAAAVSVGDPEVALAGFELVRGVDVSGMATGLGAGALERDVAHNLARLQAGQVDEAIDALQALVDASDGSAEPPTSPYALSALALGLAMSGRSGDAVACGRRVGPDPRATYLDRAFASLAVGLALTGTGDPAGADELAQARDAVDRTEDVVAQAILRLAHASALSSLGAPEAGAACDAAEQRLGELGVDAPGWRVVTDLALTPRPAPV
jgi:class 3 adenylate cyclase/tetratricopeptide (TPR) repeat protein